MRCSHSVRFGSVTEGKGYLYTGEIGRRCLTQTIKPDITLGRELMSPDVTHSIHHPGEVFLPKIFDLNLIMSNKLLINPNEGTVHKTGGLDS